MSEPNDGELLGSVLTLQCTVFDPLGVRLVVRAAGIQVADLDVVDGSALVRIDSARLPNGAVSVETQLLDADAQIIAVEVSTWQVDRAEAQLTTAEFHDAALSSVSFAVASTNTPGASLPYVLLGSRCEGEGAFNAYGLQLPLPPDQTVVLGQGVIDLEETGVGTLELPVEASDVYPLDPVRLQLLVFRDGAWRAAPRVTVVPTS